MSKLGDVESLFSHSKAEPESTQSRDSRLRSIRISYPNVAPIIAETYDVLMRGEHEDIIKWNTNTSFDVLDEEKFAKKIMPLFTDQRQDKRNSHQFSSWRRAMHAYGFEKKDHWQHRYKWFDSQNRKNLSKIKRESTPRRARRHKQYEFAFPDEWLVDDLLKQVELIGDTEAEKDKLESLEENVKKLEYELTQVQEMMSTDKKILENIKQLLAPLQDCSRGCVSPAEFYHM